MGSFQTSTTRSGLPGAPTNPIGPDNPVSSHSNLSYASLSNGNFVLRGSGHLMCGNDSHGLPKIVVGL